MTGSASKAQRGALCRAAIQARNSLDSSGAGRPVLRVLLKSAKGRVLPRRHTSQELLRFKRRGSPRLARIPQKRKGARFAAPPCKPGTDTLEPSAFPNISYYGSKTQ